MKRFSHNIVVISAIVAFLSIGLCLSLILSEKTAQADSPPTITTFAGCVCYDGASIWVANYGRNNVTKVRTSDGSILGTYNVGSRPSHICSDGNSIWVTNEGSNSVTKLKASDGTIIGTYNVGSKPSGICFDGNGIWVANYGSETVTKLRASDGTILGTYNGGSRPSDICSDGNSIWVTNDDGSNHVTKLRANDGTILGTYTVGIGPFGICSAGSSVWVTNAGSNSVTKLRASDGSTIGTYNVGSFPQNVCFDGVNIWVTNAGSNNVMKLQASDGSIISTYDTGMVLGICFDGANIWVLNGGSMTMTRLPVIPASKSSPKASEPPPKIGQASAPQIPSNILPIIIIACVIGLVIFLLIYFLRRSPPPDGLFELVCKAVKEYELPIRTNNERAIQLALYEYLIRDFPSIKMEPQTEYRDRPDLVIKHIAIEIKAPTSNASLENLLPKCMKYGKFYSKIIFALFAREYSESKLDQVKEEIRRRYPEITARFIPK
jgi:outer membrane lipoprotein-sorting protein